MNRTVTGFLMLLAVWLSGAAQAGAVYRCEQGGRTVFSDTPCDGNKPAPLNGVRAPVGSTTEIVGAYDTPYGEWRGQAQYQATANGKRIDAAHAVVPLVLSAAPDGKLTGGSSENGCKFLGIVSPGIMPQMLNVDVSLQNCVRPELNKRYFGSLIINSKDKVARLQVSAHQMGIGFSSSAELSVVMRR